MNKSTLRSLFFFTLMLVFIGSGNLIVTTPVLARGFPCKYPKGFILESGEVPVMFNEKVHEFIEYFQTTGRGFFSRWLSRSGKYIPMMRGILEEKNLPADLVYLAMIESGFNNHAISDKGAVGPWQFIDSTGKRYGLRIDDWVDERRDPEKSTRAAANYLHDLYGMFDSWELAAAGYNAGENRVQAAIDKLKVNDFWKISKHTLPEETKDYVPKLFAALIIAKNPKRYGFSGIEYQEPEFYEKVKVPSGKSLKTIAKLSRVSYERLKQLNPELINGVTPPDVGGYKINVPVVYREDVSQNYEKIRVAKDEEIKESREDTFSDMAYKYNTKSSAKKQDLFLSRISVSQDVSVKKEDHKCILLYNPYGLRVRDDKGNLHDMDPEPSDLMCIEARDINSEKLERLPEGIQFPNSLKDRIAYDADKKLLIFKGVMIKEERNVLLRLSKEPTYQKAVKRLFERSLSLDEVFSSGSGKDVYERDEMDKAHYALDLSVTEIHDNEVKVRIDVYRDFFSNGIYECSSLEGSNLVFNLSYLDPLFTDNIRLFSGSRFALVLRDIPKESLANIGIFAFREDFISPR